MPPHHPFRLILRWKRDAPSGSSFVSQDLSLPTMLVLAMSVSALPQDRLAGNGGEALYSKRCAACHDAGGSRVPDRAALRNMSSENVRFALVSGKMQFQGS